MTYRNRVKIDPIRSVAFGSIGASYSAVGTALSDPARIIKIDNLTDEGIFISIDGVNDHFVLPAEGFILLDLTSNRVRDDGFFIPDGTVFYIKRISAAPTAGAAYIEVIHA